MTAPGFIRYGDLTALEIDAADRLVRATTAAVAVMSIDGHVRLAGRLAIIIALANADTTLVPSTRARLIRYFKGI